MQHGPIGIFDSGYGGLTVLKEIVAKLPDRNFIYLGDNARSPYGPRSFETVYAYTLQAVTKLFELGCPLVVLACNTASAKALRTIQQKDLPGQAPLNRVLGVIRPTTENLGNWTQNGHVGILGTSGTIRSGTYLTEAQRFFPDLNVTQLACPMWVPLVENGETQSEGAAYFVQRDLKLLLKLQPQIDTVLLACTHYPLLMPVIERYLPKGVRIIAQGDVVAQSLENYLFRHPEMNSRCLTGGQVTFYTTDLPADFDMKALEFFGKEVNSIHLRLE